MLSILYGIASSLSWGAGDFAGGLVSRKVGAYRAVFYADFFGLLLLAFIPIFYRESFPTSTAALNAFIGGALGSCGLLILYYSLSVGQMSVAAPVSALFAALLPVIFGAITEDYPACPIHRIRARARGSLADLARRRRIPHQQTFGLEIPDSRRGGVWLLLHLPE
ncbi:MAG: DMT family transporter [Anaerolineales bacterium]